MMTPASIVLAATAALSLLASERGTEPPDVWGVTASLQGQPGTSASADVQQQTDSGRAAQAELELAPVPGYADSAPWWRGIVIFLLLPIALVVAGIFGYRRWLRAKARGNSEDDDLDDMPLLVFPVRSEAPPRNAGAPRLQPELRTPATAARDAARDGARDAARDQVREVAVEMVTDNGPTNGTLQLLPGRLEILSGKSQSKEIRFVKLPGAPAVTFGRSAGQPHSHVQVESPTVSRLHAQMRFEHGRWHIANLSATNPVVVNGQPLNENGNERVLNDGDQVEMGEVTFRFHSR